MSHIVPIELQVRNLKALELCLGQFGAELRLNQKQFAEYYGLKPCDAAIHVNGAKYEIGLKKNADGSYTLLCDFWSSGGLTQKFGQNGDKLKQAYAKQLAVMYWAAKGYKLQQITKEDGTVVLVATN